jgi:hypothetical protein
MRALGAISKCTAKGTGGTKPLRRLRDSSQDTVPREEMRTELSVYQLTSIRQRSGTV